MIAENNCIEAGCSTLIEMDTLQGKEVPLETELASSLLLPITSNQSKTEPLLNSRHMAVDCPALRGINETEEELPRSRRPSLVVNAPREEHFAEDQVRLNKNTLRRYYLRRHFRTIFWTILLISASIIAEHFICGSEKESGKCENIALRFIFSTVLPICFLFHTYLFFSEKSEIKHLQIQMR
ncbi:MULTISPECIES: hypothetical protein [Candidatus Ichthyocystis]|uniref:hypothetical protein n=1 Tax=Candidatus Ichthyocystis TaxID=2929841 RepID=UPI000B8477CF|nr:MULTISPECIES: hypothetical protein [Ichthyocystis]